MPVDIMWQEITLWLDWQITWRYLCGLDYFYDVSDKDKRWECPIKSVCEYIQALPLAFERVLTALQNPESWRMFLYGPCAMYDVQAEKRIEAG